MRRRCNKMSALFLAFVMLLVVAVPHHVVFAQSAPKHITIVHTNDTHGRIEADQQSGLIGFAKIAAIVKQTKEENPNTLVVDAGDTLHGLPIATLSKGKNVVEIMNLIGYDAMVPGNHDFNYGQAHLLELKDVMKFSLLASNIAKEDGTDFLLPYVIKEVDGVKVAIVGLATPETTYKTNPNNVKGLAFVDPLEVAQKTIDKLKGKADVVIALTHLGLDESSTDRSDIVAEKVSGIDVIIDGHSHTTLPEGKEVNGTLIVQTGDYGKNVGRVDLYVENGKVVEKKAKHIAFAETAEIAADEEATQFLANLKEENDKLTSEVVGKTPVVLDGVRENVRTRQTNLGSVIADAMLHISGADVAITNGGGLRASIDEGDITKKQVITVLPFGNFVALIEVKGEDILAAMERGVSEYPNALGAFPQVGGMTYKFDASKPAGERIVEILIGKEKLDVNKTYKLATNDFMAAGGDGYTMFANTPILAQFPALDEITADYLAVIEDAIPNADRGVVVEVQTPEVVIPEPEVVPAPEAVIPEPQVAPASPVEYIVKANDVLWKIAKQFGLDYQAVAAHNNLRNPHMIFPGQKLLIPQN